MPKYNAPIQIESDNQQQVAQIAGLLQFAVNNVDHNDLVKLLSKVKTNPGIVKTALKFI